VAYQTQVLVGGLAVVDQQVSQLVRLHSSYLEALVTPPAIGAS